MAHASHASWGQLHACPHSPSPFLLKLSKYSTSSASILSVEEAQLVESDGARLSSEETDIHEKSNANKLRARMIRIQS